MMNVTTTINVARLIEMEERKKALTEDRMYFRECGSRGKKGDEWR